MEAEEAAVGRLTVEVVEAAGVVAEEVEAVPGAAAGPVEAEEEAEAAVDGPGVAAAGVEVAVGGGTTMPAGSPTGRMLTTKRIHDRGEPLLSSC